MTSKSIGIVGAGTAGLHLGLQLRQHGVDAVIVTDRRPEQYADAPLPNTVAHHRVTIEREQKLGVDHWPAERHGYRCHRHYFGGEQPLSFRGDLAAPSRAVDYRIYLPRLMADFEARGGRIEYRRLAAQDLAALRDRFDLIVVCTGRNPLGDGFEPDPRHSMPPEPLRRLQVGLYTGVLEEEPRGATLSVAPGHGELIALPMLSFGGMVTALLLENLPGGDFEALSALRYEDDPRRFRDVLLRKMAEHHPTIRERIDEPAFDLTAPRDQLQGSLRFALRQGHRPLGEGKWAIALGDLHCTVDPVIGQGANAASHAAWILGEQIAREDLFDERFCEQFDQLRIDRIVCAARWTELMLRPPSPQLEQLIGAMSEDRALCDRFTDGFNHPELQWNRLASPARIQRWLAEARAGRP